MPQTPKPLGAPATTSQSAPETHAPGAVSIPTPPSGPPAPATVSPATGKLSVQTTDLTLPGVGPAFSFARRYDSGAASKAGPLGHGWDFAWNNRLHMYVFYDITEHRGDGGITSFRFEDGSGGAYVSAYDGDPLIHRDLSKGSYSISGAPGSTLVRERRTATSLPGPTVPHTSTTDITRRGGPVRTPGRAACSKLSIEMATRSALPMTATGV